METLLFSPYVVKGVTLKNRIVMSPMCMYSSATQDGKVTNFHLVHYASRAAGQVGLVMIEATAVTPEGRISKEDLGIWNDEHIEGLKQLTSLVQEYGAKAAIQLAHAGRKAVLDTPAVAPSPIAFSDSMKTPIELTREQIQDTVAAFREGARRAKQAGFDIIELHGAHGYLINEFLSPLANKRTDEYGGSADNRYRFLREIIEAVKEVWNGPLFVRISANDYHPKGLTIKDYVTFSAWMKEQGVDLVDCSSGAVVPAHIDVYPGYQVPYAERIKNETGIATGAVGLITSGVQAEEILQNKQADLIFIGRELLRNPYFPRTAANELGFELTEPKQYERAPGKIAQR
jgi:NADPH2 dehydrogenase